MNAPAEANEAIQISHYEKLQSEIAILQEEEAPAFDYRDPKDNKAARSYVHKIRKLKASIEKARKEAKSHILEMGHQIDDRAKEMSEQVVALMEPHEKEIKAIEAEEKERQGKHLVVVDNIERAVLFAADDTAQQMRDRLAKVKDIDTATLEEYEADGNAAKLLAIKDIEDLIARRDQYETEQAELEQLRKEKEARDKADQEAAIEQAAIRGERERAERKAAEEKAQREEEAERKRLQDEATEAERLRQIEEAKRKEAEAKTEAQAAQARADEAERREAKRLEEEEAERERRIQEAEAEGQRLKDQREAMRLETIKAIHGVTSLSTEEAEALVAVIEEGDIPHLTVPWGIL